MKGHEKLKRQIEVGRGGHETDERGWGVGGVRELMSRIDCRRCRREMGEGINKH